VGVTKKKENIMNELSEITLEGEVTEEDLKNGYTDFVINVDRERWFGIKNECEARSIPFVTKREHYDGYLEMDVELVTGNMHYRLATKPKKVKHVTVSCR
jgi:hypothetical protein